MLELIDSLSVDAVFLQFTIKRFATHAQNSGGFGFVAVFGKQSGFNQAFFISAIEMPGLMLRESSSDGICRISSGR